MEDQTICDSCGYADTMSRIEKHLVNSAFARYAAELMTLLNGISARQHVGDAVSYRLEDIEKEVREVQ